MQAIRTLFFIPVFILISPVLLILAVIILTAETGSGPLRSLYSREVRAHGFGDGSSRFMQKVFVPSYKHHVQSFVLGAAGILVVTVGLRGLGVLPVELVFFALALEFTLLVLWAITVYFTEEEEITENGAAFPRSGASLESSESLVTAIKELSGHIALLESRMRATESRFEQLASLNGSLQDLASRMNTLLGDQFNLAVKREFEQLLAELGQRVSGGNHPPK
jgi:hypothetical protein